MTAERTRIVSASNHQVGVSTPVASSTIGATSAATTHAITIHGRRISGPVAISPSAMPEITTGVSTNGPPIRDAITAVTNVAISDTDGTETPRRYDAAETTIMPAIAPRNP